MTCRVKQGRVEADLVIDFQPLEIVPLMRTRLYREINFNAPHRLATRSLRALSEARHDCEAWRRSAEFQV